MDFMSKRLAMKEDDEGYKLGKNVYKSRCNKSLSSTKYCQSLIYLFVKARIKKKIFF